jgi:hypothetical protein
MHLSLLPSLILALAGIWGSTPTHQTNAFSVRNPSEPPLFSMLAQTTPTTTVTISGTATISVTTTVTATGTISSVAGTPQATPPPLPTAVAQVPLQGNPLDIAFLTSAPPPNLKMGPFAWADLAIMAILFAVSAYFFLYRRPEWKRTDPVRYKAANRWGQMGLWISGLGLLFLLFRIVALDFFDWRFWLYLWLLVAVVAAVWFAYWLRTSYPKERAKYLRTQRARQYMPGAAKGSAKAANVPRQASAPRPQPGVAPVRATPTTSTEGIAEQATTSALARPPQRSGKRRRRR